MSYDQSNPRRNNEYNSRAAECNHTSRKTDVQSQNCDDDTTSYSHNSRGRFNEGARMGSEPSGASTSYTGEDSYMNTGSIRYDNYVPDGGGDDESESDSSSRDITSSRNSDEYEGHDQGVGRSVELRSHGAGGSNTGNDDFGAGDIGQPISNGYDSGSSGWARENSVCDESSGYAGDSPSSFGTDSSAAGDPSTSRDKYDTGSADRSLGTAVGLESIAVSSGVRSTSYHTGDSKNVRSYDESRRSALAGVSEKATTRECYRHLYSKISWFSGDVGSKSEESTEFAGANDPGMIASTTSGMSSCVLIALLCFRGLISFKVLLVQTTAPIGAAVPKVEALAVVVTTPRREQTPTTMGGHPTTPQI
ncbi:hypothetical protein DFS33DRAFT_1352768 [Desarmillaria ectypa]|nr:hypothetical protein DFS33DRAFT_1352768 [Desarmillaria ectypa]